MVPEISLSVCHVKVAVAIALLVVLWSWESWFPFFREKTGRLPRAAHNLALAVGNTVVLAVLFGTATVLVTDWTTEHAIGLLHALELAWPVQLALALVLLDGWMYFWHRANHAVPLLWRFHRVHHADTHMDVTTATRFHLGEHAGSAVLRLGLVPLVGLEFWHLAIYDVLVIAVTMFHHANITLGGWDRPLRWLFVTPFMHKVHHSRWQPETDSNYATVLSIWDRLAGTFRMRHNPLAIEFGLDEFTAPRWQTLGGMLQMPFASAHDQKPAQEREDAAQSALPIASGRIVTDRESALSRRA